MERGAGLSGLKILVVEDEPLVAMALDDSLTDSGCTVVGPASSLKKGMRLIEEHAVDGAVLDVNLRGEMVFPLADALAKRSIPFVYVTGYDKLVRACNHGCPVLQKPYNVQQLLNIIGQWRPRLGSTPSRVTYFPEKIGIPEMADSPPALNPQGRLAALHKTGLLDTPPEPAYDRLTRFVTRILNVPVSLVSLVDAGRQFFKSAIGLPEPWASLRQTPLSHSFCQHLVTADGILVVEDARNDPRVCDNLAIRDLGVVSYLGAPLVTPDGYVLGSLCAIDSKPRRWTSEDIVNLTELAGIVMSEIALREEVAQREEAGRQQRLLVKELHHRVKNTLAMVDALVTLSLRTADSLESFRDSIRDRILSLANAHSLLIERQWGSVSLRELIAGEFKPVCHAQVTAEGPELAIPAAAAVSISMGLHELLTNAIKHGALSVPTGRVRIDWSVVPEESAKRLVLRWTESGGPPVVKPKRRGFGTLLFESILGQQMNGQVAIEYAAEGLRARIELLISEGDSNVSGRSPGSAREAVAV